MRRLRWTHGYAGHDVVDLIGGGPYLCISSPVIEESDSAGKMKSVSKVEADAAAAASTAEVDDFERFPTKAEGAITSAEADAAAAAAAVTAAST